MVTHRRSPGPVAHSQRKVSFYPKPFSISRAPRLPISTRGQPTSPHPSPSQFAALAPSGPPQRSHPARGAARLPCPVLRPSLPQRGAGRQGIATLSLRRPVVEKTLLPPSSARPCARTAPLRSAPRRCGTAGLPGRVAASPVPGGSLVLVAVGLRSPRWPFYH